MTHLPTTKRRDRVPARTASLRLRPAVAGRTSGFTMMELMVTMVIMASLLGLGAGMFISLGKKSGEQQAIASVAQIVTRARNASNRFPATIVADPAQGKILAFTDEVLQELHFDPRPIDGGQSVTSMGIQGLDCTIAGRLEPTSGRVGGAARIDGGGIDCGNYAIYDVKDGISVEAWIKPAQSPACDIVSKGQVFRVAISGGSGMSLPRLSIRMKLENPDGRQDLFEKSVALPKIRANEWFGVRASFDRREIVLETNDGFGWITRERVVFEKEEERRRTLAIDQAAPLKIGVGLAGWVDDIRIGGIRAAEPVEVPPGMSVLQGNTIRFVGGRLDTTMHSGVENLVIRAPGRTMRFVIGQDGTVLDVIETEALPTDPAPKAQRVVETPVQPEKKE